ncbi:hypothetical protein PNEG_02119 [Pneumocystis murina B123]|uniref:DNA replication complex GINS protein PSF1 n=1 Tax=Pneumocystis murina (strain B123) TaxID=1069680 RepID=M7NLJ2_PNEMU|nr:hypothetical protein PNEG_02119 [Pneumocystis murina B123]EMR09533.1 hypothetical protein PNEG_02119 [Pneumocystis murina B123]
MFGDLATKLILDAKRTQHLNQLPHYQTDLIQSIFKETDALNEASKELLTIHGGPEFSHSKNPGIATHLLIQHLCQLRNKRCLMAYHHTRLNRLNHISWFEINPFNIPWIATSLSPDEHLYLRKYITLLTHFKSQWMGIDFNGDLEPPKDLYINIRVLQDVGEIQTEYGAITLNKNSQFFLRQSDVEGLIQQGYLQKV